MSSKTHGWRPRPSHGWHGRLYTVQVQVEVAIQVKVPMVTAEPLAALDLEKGSAAVSGGRSAVDV